MTTTSKHTGRFVGYYRISTRDQDEAHRKATGSPETGGYSLETQRDAVRAYVANVGGELVADFTEIESGRKSTRPQLLTALARARETGADLIIAKLDRLARNVHFLSGLLEQTERTGVNFLALDLPGANRFTLHIMAAVAQQESDRLSERTKIGVQKARERGAKLGGVRPGMLRAHAHLGGERRRAMAIAHYRAQHIDELIDVLRSAPTHTYQSIADRFNARGNVRTSSGGTRWTKDMVRKVHRMLTGQPSRPSRRKDVA